MKKCLLIYFAFSSHFLNRDISIYEKAGLLTDLFSAVYVKKTGCTE